MWYNLPDLVWQYDYVGGSTPINKRLLVCTRTCLDELNFQFALQILPPDPPPLYNVRPEPFTLDENGPTQNIESQVFYPAATITNFYLDLYNGDPTNGGTSVLAAITGSGTRTNFASSMSSPGSGVVSTNTAAITFTTNCRASTNVSYLAVYSAASGGTLLTSAPLFDPQTVVLYNGLAFGIGSLTAIVAVILPEDLLWGSQPLLWGAGNTLQW